MSALALSVVLSFVSAVAYAGGAIVQEQIAVSSSPGERYGLLRRGNWWTAMALNGLGGLLHVVALAYGPLSLVQPLGALTIVFALPMAALFVGRRAGGTAWRGAVMATVGLAGLLSLVGTSDGRSLDGTEQVEVGLVTGSAVVALMIAGRAVRRHRAVRSVLLATASGTAFGMSSVFTKTVAVDWTHGIALADLPSLAVIGVFAVGGVLLSQASYRGGGLAAPLATLTVVNPVLAAAVGITLFGETFRHGGAGTALALGCGVLTAGGLILLTTERTRPAEPLPAEQFPVEPLTAAGAGAGSLPLSALAGPVAAGEPLAGLPHQRGAAERAQPGPGRAAERRTTPSDPGPAPEPRAFVPPDGGPDREGGGGTSATYVLSASYGPFHSGVCLPLASPDPHCAEVRS
ncbi:DMT family transporter [Streptomyces sp. NPDC006012]|uniref:DMT family transporter n=1 Tax=Streptomyces sp. NPDC006012 TaxID=3364739 RepID=UPI00367D30BF